MSNDKKNLKIFIIDDEPSIVNLIFNLLKNFGYKVEFTTDAAKGLKIIQEKEFDVIFLDLCMPKESGLTILKKIKAVYPLTQIIVITGYSSEFSLKACLKAGADEFICKPFDVDDLIKALERCAERLETYKKIETLEKIVGDKLSK